MVRLLLHKILIIRVQILRRLDVVVVAAVAVAVVRVKVCETNLRCNSTIHNIILIRHWLNSNVIIST